MSKQSRMLLNFSSFKFFDRQFPQTVLRVNHADYINVILTHFPQHFSHEKHDEIQGIKGMYHVTEIVSRDRSRGTSMRKQATTENSDNSAWP